MAKFLTEKYKELTKSKGYLMKDVMKKNRDNKIWRIHFENNQKAKHDKRNQEENKEQE
jgi:hypothetical protein